MPRKDIALLIGQSDYQRLSALVASCHRESVENLEEELGKAAVLDEGALPAGLVRMNSVVTVRDLGTDALLEITLVYPHEANASAGRISVLAPLGMALIGLRVGQRYDWRMPDGRTKEFVVVAASPAAEAA